MFTGYDRSVKYSITRHGRREWFIYLTGNDLTFSTHTLVVELAPSKPSRKNLI